MRYNDEPVQNEWEFLLEDHLGTQKELFAEHISVLEKQNHSKITSLEQEFTQLLEDKLRASRKVRCIERQKQLLEKKTKELEKKMQEISKETYFLQEILEGIPVPSKAAGVESKEESPSSGLVPSLICAENKKKPNKTTAKGGKNTKGRRRRK